MPPYYINEKRIIKFDSELLRFSFGRMNFISLNYLELSYQFIKVRIYVCIKYND